MSSRIIKGLYQITVYTIGIFVLLAAVTATLVRLFLPDIGMYRSEIEAWVSNYMDLPVAIRTIRADWHGWTPFLYLEDIDLLNRAGTSPIMKFESAQLSIDPVATLLRRQIIPERLIISGFEISLTREADGSIDVKGMEADKARQQDSENNELAAWLFSQRHIELQQIKIEWTDETLAQLPVLLADVSLVLRSDGNRLQMEGSSLLPSMYGDSLEFAIDVTGDLLGTDWAAELFVQGKNINPDFWYRKYWPKELNLTGGNATISMWSSWQHAGLSSMQGRLDYSDFEYGTDEGTDLEVQKLSASFKSQKNQDGQWLTSINIDEFTTQNGSWEPSMITLMVAPDQTTHTVNFDYLKLDDIYPFLSTLSFLPSTSAQTLAGYPLRGILRDGRIHHARSNADGRQLEFDLLLDELGMPASPGMPQLKGISARVQGTLQNGRIRFSNEETSVAYTSVDKLETIPLIIGGDLAWSADQDGYRLFTNRLQIQNQDATARLAGTISLAGHCCRINMIAEADTTSVDAFIRNLPYTDSFRLRDWLQRSVRNGSLNQARALFRGSSANFPFDQHNGVFELLFDVSGTTLDYSQRWPVIDDINGQVGFSGRTMTININEGRVFNAAISTATAVIPDLLPRQKTVHVDGQISGTTDDLKKYVLQSPLTTNQMLAGVAESLSNEGQVELGLQLAVPLRAPDKQTEINGQLKLANTTLATDLDDLRFTDINGEAQFTRNTISADKITASYAGYPVQLSVNSTDTGGVNPVTIAMTGNGDNQFISGQINRYFPGISHIGELLETRLSGSTDWQASLTYSRNSDNNLERTLRISSDLYGMNVKLPDPLSKHAYLRTGLEIHKNLDNDELPLTVRYGNILTSDILFDKINGLRKIDVNFGNKTYMYPVHEGILLYGQIDQLALDEWFALLNRESDSGAGNSTPIQADLALNNLYVMGQQFNDTTVRATYDQNSWNVRLGGESVSGTLTIPTRGDKEEPIVAELAYLKLKRINGNNGNNANRIVPSSLPSINAHVGSFHYAELDLGEMEFIAGAADYGLYIDTLSFSKPSFTIEATGKWNGTDNITNSSDFTIQAHAAELDSMLKTFGYDVTAVKKGETNFVIDANWDGTPMDFSLNKLNGTLGLKIGKGQLLDIQPSAGRLFGLLSLQTLPRRLTLDFSDLFGDGMAFDRIEGNFEIRNGDAYTDDLIMKGPSVDILISGRTGLSTHDYDQTAEITPQISDSLAVASGFLGPMGIGLGTVLYLAGNMFEPLQDSINKIMKFKYSISGSWNDPVIEKQRNDRQSSG